MYIRALRTVLSFTLIVTIVDRRKRSPLNVCEEKTSKVMKKLPKNDSSIQAANITSRRAMIGVIIGVLVTVSGSIVVAIINKSSHSAPSPTQTFIGRVFSKNNPNEVVRNARVTMEGEGVPQLATTDSQGIFSFPLSDPHKEVRLRVEVSGYEPYDLRVVPAKNHGLQAIPLTPEINLSEP